MHIDWGRTWHCEFCTATCGNREIGQTLDFTVALTVLSIKAEFSFGIEVTLSHIGTVFVPIECSDRQRRSNWEWCHFRWRHLKRSFHYLWIIISTKTKYKQKKNLQFMAWFWFVRAIFYGGWNMTLNPSVVPTHNESWSSLWMRSITCKLNCLPKKCWRKKLKVKISKN